MQLRSESLRNKIRRTMSARCFKDNRGVAAVEFALIVPILLLLFVGTLEISLAVAVDRKISRISSSVADLITQEDNYTKDDLNKISDIAARIMYPYYTEPGESSAIKISIVGVEINSSNVAKVLPQLDHSSPNRKITQ